MAEGQRMTAADVAVEQLMRSEHVDVLRESVAMVVQELMEGEVAALISAELGERAPRCPSVAVKAEVCPHQRDAPRRVEHSFSSSSARGEANLEVASNA